MLSIYYIMPTNFAPGMKMGKTVFWVRHPVISANM